MTAKLDLSGRVFGSWTVLRSVGVKNRKRVWLCQCSCGVRREHYSSVLLGGRTKTCRRCRRNGPGAITPDWKEGKQIGPWTILKLDVLGTGPRNTTWSCRCTCGSEERHTTYYLRVVSVKPYRGCRRCRPSRIVPEAAFFEFFKRYRKSAIQRGLEFSISQDQFQGIVQKDCHYCGSPPIHRVRNKKDRHGFVGNGVDRKNNTGGYTVDNSLPCCFPCNRAKGIMSYEGFQAWLGRVADFRLRTNPP